MQQRFGGRWNVGAGVGTFSILTHLLAGVAALAVAAAAQRGNAAPWLVAVLALGAACATGWLLTIELRRNLQLTELALQRLTDGQPIAALPSGPRWPLAKLIALVDALGTRERQYGALRQQMLTHTEQAAVQEERNRLARDLHDSIKQQLFSINVQAAAAQARWNHDPQAAQGAVADVRRSAHEAMVEMRALLQQLQPAPLETVGLIEALRDQCEALGYRSGAHVATHFGALPSDDQLPPGAQDALFRIAQEALGNVARHARAEHVALHLDQHDDALLLQVRDDGQGFDPQHAHGGMGLGNMRERVQLIGGTITMESAPGSGTVLTVRVPLVQPVVQEDSMSAETKALVRRAIKWQAVAGIAGGVGIVAFTILGYYLESGFMGLLQRVSLLICIASLVFGFWIGRKARTIQKRLELAYGTTSVPVEWLRTLDYGTQYVLCVLQTFVLPFVWFGPYQIKFYRWNAVAMALMWGGVAIVYLVLFLRSEQCYRAQLPVHELHLLLEKEAQSLKVSVPLELLFAVVVAYTNRALYLGKAVVPPQSTYDWTTIIVMAIPILFLGAVVSNLWRYWQARRLLNREVRV